MGSASETPDFTSIPVLDYSLLPADRAAFLSQLRHALTNVGFMQLRNTPVPWSLVQKLVGYAGPLFALPDAEKEKLEMSTNPHFLGYNRLGYEITKGLMDRREQWDLAPDVACRWKGEADPIHRRTHGPAPGVWPVETEKNGLVGFKETTLDYIRRITDFSFEFLRLIEEAVGIVPGSLEKYFADDQVREGGSIKIVRYPAAAEGETTQGVGPHKDPWITFLVQGDDLPGLQVQNHAGDWVDCPPMEGCFVTNFGTLLETATHGRIIATTHRVESPPASAGRARISMPFFQRIALDAVVAPLPASCFVDSGAAAAQDDAPKAISDAAKEQYPISGDSPIWGSMYLWNRLRSHPDVGYRWYPDLMPKVMEGFVSGHPFEVERRRKAAEAEAAAQVGVGAA
ncbi:Clavaminate synthase-like protein [Hyaloraphidium curvatum]|nr:Clavaminate synthase-like protein [Hyaloraphidium curvatum]